MKVETKYSTDDKVWVKYDGKLKRCKIHGVIVKKFRISERFIIEYHLGGIVDCYYESELFPTKQALLDSL